MALCELSKLHLQAFAISEFLKTTSELDIICSTKKIAPMKRMTDYVMQLKQNTRVIPIAIRLT